eukprot:jgi/Botrbrau1/19442/Bobra.0338s0064.1
MSRIPHILRSHHGPPKPAYAKHSLCQTNITGPRTMRRGMWCGLGAVIEGQGYLHSDILRPFIHSVTGTLYFASS